MAGLFEGGLVHDHGCLRVVDEYGSNDLLEDRSRKLVVLET